MDKDLKQIIDCLIALYEYEASTLPMMDSTTGRLLYFRFVKQVLLEMDQHQSRPLKEIYGDAALSEKALRLRLRDFEEAGLISTQVSQGDARVRCAQPTEKFSQLMQSHIAQAKKILADHFFMISK